MPDRGASAAATSCRYQKPCDLSVPKRELDTTLPGSVADRPGSFCCFFGLRSMIPAADRSHRPGSLCPHFADANLRCMLFGALCCQMCCWGRHCITLVANSCSGYVLASAIVLVLTAILASGSRLPLSCDWCLGTLHDRTCDTPRCNTVGLETILGAKEAPDLIVAFCGLPCLCRRKAALNWCLLSLASLHALAGWKRSKLDVRKRCQSRHGLRR